MTRGELPTENQIERDGERNAEDDARDDGNNYRGGPTMDDDIARQTAETIEPGNAGDQQQQSTNERECRSNAYG